MEKITIEKAIKNKDAIFIDTRSSKEYEIDTIPGSLKVSILDDEQRHSVGLLYKSNSEKGLELGYKYYNENLPEITKSITDLDKSKKIVVFCWRGGMRSKNITELALKLGYDAMQLDGGYKAYRAFIRKKLEDYKPPKLVVLHGLAGCGKTDLIKKLKPSIDLEDFAQHRSSLFGALGLKPSSQKKFETLLFNRLEAIKDEKFIFIEGESRKIGNIFIPDSVFKAMEKGISIKVNCSVKNRAKRIVKDYFTHGEDEKIKRIIISLKQFLTKAGVEKLIRLMDDKNYEDVAKRLLEEYYDPRYNNNSGNYDYEVNSDSIQECVQELNKLNILNKENK